jgi:hypothetical protein
MEDKRRKWVVNGIEHIEEDIARYDLTKSYGIQEPTYDYHDKLYELSYDPDISKLLLNRVIVKGFQQANDDTEQVFIEVFSKLADANKYKTVFDHDYVTETEVKVKANQAHVIINNIKTIPPPLRRAMFKSVNNGEILRVRTVITKKLAIKNNLDIRAIDDYFSGLLTKNRKLRVPKTY